MADGVLARLREQAQAVPADGPRIVVEARQRALQAVETTAAALQVDPTLAEADRDRDILVLSEILRQLRHLARQAQAFLEQRRLAELPGTQREIARLGRVNPQAPEELDAASRHAVVVADRIRDAALPDWNTPRRIRDRSTRLLPSPSRLEDIAEDLRRAVRPSTRLSHPDPRAVQIAELADQITAIAAAIDTQREASGG